MNTLNLHFLERRWVRGDMNELYEWLKGIKRGGMNKGFFKINIQDRPFSCGYKLNRFHFCIELVWIQKDR